MIAFQSRIMELIQDGTIAFHPAPKWEHHDKQGRGIADIASVPLGLGAIVYVLPEEKVYEKRPEERTPAWWQRHGKKYDLRREPGNMLYLPPGHIALVETLEVVKICFRKRGPYDPKKRRYKKAKNYVGYFTGRTMEGAREGLIVHCTAPWIWPRTNHRVTGEAVPVSKQIGAWLKWKEPRFQMVFMRGEGDLLEEVTSRTNGQRSPIGEHHHHRRGHPDLRHDAVFVEDAVAAAIRDDPNKVVRLGGETRQKHHQGQQHRGQGQRHVPYRQRRRFR
jgi:hypothetical protein